MCLKASMEVTANAQVALAAAKNSQPVAAQAKPVPSVQVKVNRPAPQPYARPTTAANRGFVFASFLTGK